MLIFLTFLFIICKNFPISHPDHSLNLCEIKDMLEMVLFYKNATAKENLFIFTKCCIIYKYKLNYKNKKSVTLNNLIMELKLLIEILLSNNQDINWIENYNKIIKAVVELNEALCKFIMKNQNKKGIKYSKKMIDKLNSTIIYKSENIKKYLYRKKGHKKIIFKQKYKEK
ncbi:hypothetical protein TUBRATIS_19580 [Tubulinosema ratisbonensis]|uniref:Uncharacterized protein n=1 Tax=Tubulinosema ratisbonensis TaxID=291195 RepID=A0A437AKK7_9MICR|nr:hypothetical protein TUBRATIS_19580 [Tubulinosema ratisbonensis]